jgi:release factor glutamine methyltransferase
MENTMLPIKQILKNATQQLTDCGNTTTPALDAEILLAYKLNKSREHFIGNANEMVEQNIMNDVLQRRLTGEPIAYIIGTKEFWGMDFKVTKDTLIPRPETELIIEKSLEFFPKNSEIDILDLGTGTGCILIALLSEFQSAKGLGIDLSNEVLEVAKHNSKGRAEFIQSDWFKNIGDRKFDLIVSNPPYISRSETLIKSVEKFEPHSALFAENDGYECYETIAKDLKKYLKPNGRAIFEFGQGQATIISKIFSSNGFVINEICKDLAGIERCITTSAI